MSGKSAKMLRRLLGIDLKNANEIQKRVYRRLKKSYTQTPEPEKNIKYNKTIKEFI